MTATQLIEQWDKCLNIIRDNVSATAFNTWFSNTKPASYAGNVLTIFVPSQFVYEYIEDHYVDLLSAAIYRVFGSNTQLNYRVLVVADAVNPGIVNQGQEPNRKDSVKPNNQKSDDKTPGPIAVPARDLRKPSIQCCAATIVSRTSSKA